MTKTWLVLDVNSLAWTAFHALPELSHHAVRTEIPFGVLRYVTTLQERFATNNMVFCFDKGRSLRCGENPDYKRNRRTSHPDPAKEQAFKAARNEIALLRDDYLPSVGFNNVLSVEGFEADDLIASVATNLPKGNSSVLVSSDQDLYQLLNSKTSIWHHRSKEMVTAKSFTKEYGIEPCQWIEVKAIGGCSSDNVDGIDGVAEKTAIKYLRKELKQSYKSYKSIEDGKEKIEQNRKLVKLPFPGTPIFTLRDDNITRERWHALLDRLGIKRMGELNQPTFKW